jgi:hypothetical protein
LDLAHNELRYMAANFFEHYCGTPGHPIPFAGRAAELATLDAWLAEATAPSRLLVSGGMARGKSALLVQWARQIGARDPATHHILFLPISVRFGTNEPTAIFEAMSACLAAIGGIRLQAPTGDPVLYYRDQAAGLLREVAPIDGLPCLVIIDGLDEADGLNRWLETFPASISPALRLVITARSYDEDGATSWRRRLNWDQPQRPSRVLEIGPLSEVAVHELVRALEPPLPKELLAAVGSALSKQSGGDALLLRWLVQDLQSELSAGRVPDLASLESRPLGLAAFVRDELIKHTAATTGSAAHSEEAADAALAVLAGAFGPLPENDLWEVLQRMLPTVPARQRLLDAVVRFVTRTRDGRLALAHPRLNQLVTEELLTYSPVLKRAAEQLLAWQINAAQGLEKNGSARPSPYLLTYHARHLAAADHVQPTTVTTADWARLMSKAWLLAKKASSGWAGVAEDIGAVRRALYSAAKGGDRTALAALLRAALVLASLRSWGGAVPPVLLWLACRAGLLLTTEAEQSAEMLGPEDQSEAFALLATAGETPERREQLLQRSLDAACEVARWNDTTRSCERAARVLGRILEPSRVPELVERLTRSDSRFMPDGLAHLCAALADPIQLPHLAGAISDRLSSSSNAAQFYLTCAERLTGDSREAALRDALTAARGDPSHDCIREEIAALLKLGLHGEAQVRAREWLSAVGPQDLELGSNGRIVMQLGQLLVQAMLRPNEIEPVLQQIAAKERDEQFPWLYAECLAGHRDSLPTLDRLVRSTLAKAIEPQAGDYARRVLVCFSMGLTREERAMLCKAVAADPPDIRAIHLARILAGTPREDMISRGEVSRETRAAILRVDPPSLRIRSLYELAVADDDSVRWCVERAFETASGSKEALLEIECILWLAEATDPVTIKQHLFKLLQLARSAGDAPSRWRLLLALVADDPEKQKAAAQDAYAAARAEMPDVASAIGILRQCIGAMSPDNRREAHDEGLRWLRADEAAVESRSVEASRNLARQVDFTVHALPADEIKAEEVCTVLAECRALKFTIGLDAEGAIAWKYMPWLIEAPALHDRWFREFQSDYLERVQSVPQAAFYAVRYFVACANLAPTRRERQTFVWDGWRHLSAQSNPWKADDDLWHETSQPRATGLYALATIAPWWLAFALRRGARKLDAVKTLGGANGLDGSMQPSNSGSNNQRGEKAVEELLTNFFGDSHHEERLRDRCYGYDKMAKIVARFATVNTEAEAAALLVLLLKYVANLPRRDALDMLSQANRPLVAIIGVDAIKVALEDVVQIWP